MPDDVLAGGVNPELQSVLRAMLKEVITEVLTGMVDQHHPQDNMGLEDQMGDGDGLEGLGDQGDEEEDEDSVMGGDVAPEEADEDSLDEGTIEGEPLVDESEEGEPAPEDEEEGDEGMPPEEGEEAPPEEGGEEVPPEEEEEEEGSATPPSGGPPRKQYAEMCKTSKHSLKYGEGTKMPPSKKYAEAAPSSTNAFVPKQMKRCSKMARDQKPVRTDESEETAAIVRYRRDAEQANERAQAAEQVAADALAEAEFVRKRYARDRVRRGKLSALVAEGFDFDVEEELEDTAELNKDKFAKHLEKIKTRYSRIPLNSGPIASRDHPASDDEDLEGLEQTEAVVRYSREKGIPYQEVVDNREKVAEALREKLGKHMTHRGGHQASR